MVSTLVFALLASTSGVGEGIGKLSPVQIAAPPYAPAPPVSTCEMRTELWCIEGFSGTINLIDNGVNREWQLKMRIAMEEPLVIIESRKCLGTFHKLDVKLVTTPTRTSAPVSYVSTEVQLTDDGCTLEFRWPRTDASIPQYRGMMLYYIRVGTADTPTENMRRLAEFISK